MPSHEAQLQVLLFCLLTVSMRRAGAGARGLAYLGFLGPGCGRPYTKSASTSSTVKSSADGESHDAITQEQARLAIR